MISPFHLHSHISIDWSAPNIWVLIAQLVEHCSVNAEAMGSNPAETQKIFFGLKFSITQIGIATAIITSSFT